MFVLDVVDGTGRPTTTDRDRPTDLGRHRHITFCGQVGGDEDARAGQPSLPVPSVSPHMFVDGC